MAWLYRFAIRYPKSVHAIALLITVAIAPGALRLKLRTDGHALVPPREDAVLFDRQIRDEFGFEDPIVVLIQSDDPHGIFNAHTVKLIHDLTETLRSLDGVRPFDLSSLATEHNYRVITGTLKFRTLLDPLPDSRTELDRLRQDIRNIRLYDGTVIAFDDHAACILIGIPPGVDRVGFYGDVRRVVDHLGEVPEEIHVIGAPVAEALLGTHILQDLGVPDVVLGHRVPRVGGAGWQAPKDFYEFRLFIGRHVGLVPIAIGIIMLVFLAGFRSLTAALLPLLEVGACLVAVFGLMGWFGVPVYLTIAVLPVILTAMGVADEIHVFNRYLHELRERPGQYHLDSLHTAMAEMWRPVVKTSVTTAVAFLSFALSPLRPVMAFGVFTAVGIIFCMLWSLTVIPAQLALIQPRRFVRASGLEAEGRRGGSARLFEGLAHVVTRGRVVIVILAVVVAALAPLGVRRILVQDSWIDGFAPDSEFHRATRTFNDRFLGMHILLVCLDTGHRVITGELGLEAVGDHTFRLPGDLVDDPQSLVGWHVHFERQGTPGDEPGEAVRPRRRPLWQWGKARIESAVRLDEAVVITTPKQRALVKAVIGLMPGETLAFALTPQRLGIPEALQQIERFERFIASFHDLAVGGVIGPADYVATTRYMKLRKEEARRIPDTAEGIAETWADYRRIRGPDRLRQIVDADFARCLIFVFMKNANFVDTGRLMNEIRDYQRRRLAPQGMTVAFAGDVAVSQTLIDAIVTTQVRSLLLSLVGILAVTILLGRSLVYGILAVLPCTLAVLVNFAVMGLVGMPLGVATSMFAGMTLGIGVDYAIHLLERYRLGRSRGLERGPAVAHALARTGPAVCIDALAVGLGFGVMVLSQVPANARLGGLVVLSIAGCLAATLVLLPALLSFGRTRPAGHIAPAID